MADRGSASIQVGILTASDSCFNGAATDRSGENLKQLVESGKLINGTVVTKDILPDEYDQIKAKLLHWSDNLKLDLILTTGGTGFSIRDVTPEATKAVLEKEALGMTVAMLKGSLDITPLAMLTRLTCGTRGKTLIINLPGSTKGSAECFEIASKGIPHAVDLLRGHKQEVMKTHATLQSEGIRFSPGSHQHQPHVLVTQAETIATNDLPMSEEQLTSAHSLATASHHLKLKQKSSQPVKELVRPNNVSGSSSVKQIKNFTSEVLHSTSTSADSFATPHFWKTLLSLSETARTNLANLESHSSVSPTTGATSVSPLAVNTHHANHSQPVFSLSEAVRMNLTNLGHQSSVSLPTVGSSVSLLPGNTNHASPAKPLASSLTHPELLKYGKGSLTESSSKAPLTLSPSINANSNSYASIPGISSGTTSCVPQPRAVDAILHYLHTAPSLPSASVVLPEGHNVSLPCVSSSRFPLVASNINSKANSVTSLPLGTSVMNSNTISKPSFFGALVMNSSINSVPLGNSIIKLNNTPKPPVPLQIHPAGEFTTGRCVSLKSNPECSLPVAESIGKSCSLTQLPVCTDSLTCLNTSPTATDSYRSSVIQHDTGKDRHQHPKTCITQDCSPPASAVFSSNHLLSLEDSLSLKSTDAFQHIRDIKYTIPNQSEVKTASAPQVEILLENNSHPHVVCRREIKPVVDCAGNPLVQILLPCSQHLHSSVSSAQNRCISSTTNIKKCSLRTIVKNNRTRILNILKKQNKFKKACSKDVKKSSNEGSQLALQTAAEADVDLDDSFEIDIENEDKMNSSLPSLYHTHFQQLGDNTQPQDITTSKEIEVTTAAGIVATGSHEVYDKSKFCFDSQSDDSVNDEAVVPLTADQYQETSVRKSHTLCMDTGSAVQIQDNDLQNEYEISPKHPQISESCANDHTLSCPESTLSLVARWSTTPVSGTATIKTAKIHNVRQQVELFYVPVGKSFKTFIREHPLIQDIYLHKGKREIKKQLARLCRQCDISAKMTTWRRGAEILERNCFDDYFELTEAGMREQEEVLASRKRDQYIVNWYVWCPGHGNCRRKCGGYGACAYGCQGMQHKQDRHNCSLMVNMKLLLSDLTTWRVSITGTHVPGGSGIIWSPPVPGSKPSSERAKHNHSISDVAKCKKMFHSKKVAMESSGNSHGGTAALSSSLVPDVWNIVEPSDESRTLIKDGCESLKIEANLQTTAVESSTNIPTKKRISKMLSSLKRRREERMTTYKSLSGNPKIPSLTGASDRQTTSEMFEEEHNSNIQLQMNDANNSCALESNCDLKQESVIKKVAITLTPSDIRKSVVHQSASANSSSQQGQLLSSELLHFLTCSIPQSTALTLTTTTTASSNTSINHTHTLPSGYLDSFGNTLTPESDSLMDITAAFGSPTRQNMEESSLNLSSLSHSVIIENSLCTADVDQPEVLDIQPLDTNSYLQEDTASLVKCKEVLKNSEIFPTLSFEQPFLSANTLGEILQQASSDFHYNFEEQADHSAKCMDANFSEFSNLDNFAAKCQLDQVNSACKFGQICQHPEPGTGSQSPPVLHHVTSVDAQQLLVPSAVSLTLDSLMTLNGLPTLSENAVSSVDTYPTSAVTANTYPSCSSNTLETVPHFLAPQHLSQTVATEATLEETAQLDSSCCKSLPADALPALPSYHEATLALAQQLVFSHPGNKL